MSANQRNITETRIRSRSRRRINHSSDKSTIASRSFPVIRKRSHRKDKEVPEFKPRSKKKKNSLRSRPKASIVFRKPIKRSRKKITAIYADGIGKNKIVSYVRHTTGDT